MNVLLLNNTELYHSGSYAVISFVRQYFKEDNLIILKSIKQVDFSNIDLVILNGEGSTHNIDNRPKVLRWLEILNEAAEYGIKTAVINSVWENNSKSVTGLLKKIDYVSVREILSKNQILEHIDRPIDINLDLSYFYPIRKTLHLRKGIISGNAWSEKEKPKISGINEDGSIDIFTQSWEEIIKILSASELVVTGRHHEMYAACKAECPFIVFKGNSHKNQGLLKTFKIDIPVLESATTVNEILNFANSISLYQEEYSQLFFKMKVCTPPNILKNVKLVSK